VRFLALPSAASPRVLADGRARSLVARVVRGQTGSPKPLVRLGRHGLSVAARAGLVTWIPRTSLFVHGSKLAASIEDPLRGVLGIDEIRIAMSFGPPRANRKPVLQVVDAGGQVLAFVKVGHNDLTEALVRREAECLRTLSGLDWSDVVLPRSLDLVEWRDLVLFVQSPLAMPNRRMEEPAARSRLLAVVDEIAASSGLSTSAWGDHPLRSRLLKRLGAAGVAGAPWRDALLALPQDLEVRTGSWHGDLNPGNLALTHERCPVWDWERSETGVPLGFDLLHYVLQDALTRQGDEPAEAAHALLSRAPSLLERFGHGPAQADLVARAYLVTLADRYLADDQERAGARIGAVRDWLLPALVGSVS
jgi:hypothetical protein